MRKLEAIKGRVFEKSFIVLEENTARNIKSGGLSVLSTPSLIAFMENTVYVALEQFLLSTETSVGTNIEIKHLKASSVGEKIYINAVVTEIYKNKISFKILAKDIKGLIGEALHTRAIINTELFLKNIEKK